MKNIFYNIWVDAIVNIKRNPQHKGDWKFYSMFFMTLLISLNIGTIVMWVGYFGIKAGIYKINLLQIDIFPGTMLDSFSMFLIQFALPSFLLNYFMVIYKGKYKILIENYKDKNGKLFLFYLFITLALFLIPVLFYWWLH